MLVSLTLFVSVVMSFNYVGASLTPGQAAVLSLNDKFFYLALAMIVTALVAASQWDALAIDARDAAILEPLPVAAGTIRRAKLSAVAILGAAVAVAVNAFPSVVFPSLLVFNFRQMSVVAMLWLMATHAMVTRRRGGVRLSRRRRASGNAGRRPRAALVHARLTLGAGRAHRDAGRLAPAAAAGGRPHRATRIRGMAGDVAADVVSRRV